MTEKQLNNLKRILDHSKQDSSPEELDAKILGIALQAAEHTKRSEESGSAQRIAFSQIAISCSAVALTIAILFSLGQILSVEELNTDLATTGTPSITEDTSQEAVAKSLVGATQQITEPSQPVPPASRPTITKYDDSQVVKLSLPSSDSLLQKMAIPPAYNRSEAAALLSSAMHDINLMIQEGEVHRARERYQQLRQLCSYCPLPESLEALAAIRSTQFDSG